MSDEPDFQNLNRMPVISVMDLARLDDDEQAEGYRDGGAGLPCGDNRSRSYWHGWRQGARDGGHRAKDGDFWDSMLTSAVAPNGDISTLRQRVEDCRETLREIERREASR